MNAPIESARWRELMAPEWLAALAVLLGGILLHSMNVLLIATVMPSIVDDVGGSALISWPTVAYSASSIFASSCGALVTASLGASSAYVLAAGVFAAGTLACALAPGIEWVIAGRFVQGLGGGVLSVLAYVVIRNVFPERLWARAFAALAGVWSVSVVVGPFVGGVFADLGMWRGAFYTVAAIAIVLALLAGWVLPRTTARNTAARQVPWARLILIITAIACVSLASIAGTNPVRLMLTVSGLCLLAWMLHINRTAQTPLLPSDAFSTTSVTGSGLWVVLLVSAAFAPLQIYAPVFLQRLHQLSPLSAGYVVAIGSLSWTVAAIIVSHATPAWPRRLVVTGPLAMALGLTILCVALPAGPIAGILAGVIALGAGIGCCWAFLAQFVMQGARPGQEDLAAAAVPTVQITGLALGAALAGLIANAHGFAQAAAPEALLSAARWVPGWFAILAAAGALTGWRLRALSR